MSIERLCQTCGCEYDLRRGYCPGCYTEEEYIEHLQEKVRLLEGASRLYLTCAVC